jgi:hypothetical protein
VFTLVAKNKLVKGIVLKESGYFHGVTWKYAEEFDTWWSRLPE